MRELNVMEVQEVSGGCLSRIGAMFLGGVDGGIAGTYKGAVTAGSSGGLLGFGLIGALVGAIWGGVYGVAQGTVYGFINDWGRTLELFNEHVQSWLDPNAPPPKV